MKQFTKQLLFIIIAGAVITAGGLAIYSAVPSGNLKIKPSLTPKVKVVNQENTTTTGNNPVAWWKMDEGTGQYAYNVSGNGNTGTLGTSTVADGADPTWTTGKLGKGLSFDGSNDYVALPASNSFGFSSLSSITFSSWVKTTNASNQDVLFFERATGSTGISLALGRDSVGNDANDGKPLGTYRNSANAFSICKSSTAINDGNWHYISWVINGANGTFYVDGISKATVSNIHTANTFTFSSGIAKISTDYNGNLPFKGVIDDVRIFNRALTAGEVGQMYNSTKDGYLGKIKVSTGLVGYWKLDDNNALTSVIDYSGKGNTGTAYSSTATSTSVLSTSTAMIGRAMSFDGVDDYVDVGSATSLRIRDKITISAWVKRTGTLATAYGGIVTNTPTTAQFNYLLSVYGATNQIHCAFQTNLGTSQLIHSQVLAINEWYYVTMTADGSYLRLYVNGANPASVAQTTLTYNWANTYIGNWRGASFHFPGIIDEVRVYNRALSATEIEQSYQRGLMGKEQ